MQLHGRLSLLGSAPVCRDTSSGFVFFRSWTRRVRSRRKKLAFSPDVKQGHYQEYFKLECFLLDPETAACFSCFASLAAILHVLEFGMSELISPLRSQDTSAVFENLQARLREMAADRQTDAVPSPAIKMQVRPSPKMLAESEAEDSVSRVQAEAQRGVDMASVHSGLDPQRVAKLLGLLD